MQYRYGHQYSVAIYFSMSLFKNKQYQLTLSFIDQ